MDSSGLDAPAYIGIGRGVDSLPESASGERLRAYTGAGQTSTTIPTPGAAGVVFVETEANFPAPVGPALFSDLGDAVYIIDPGVSIPVSFPIKFTSETCNVIGYGSQSSGLNFTFAGPGACVLNDVGISVKFGEMSIQAPDAPIFDVTGDATALFTLRDVIFINTLDFGSVQDFVRNEVSRVLVGFDVTGGLVFKGNSTTILMLNTQSAANVAAPTFDFSDPSLVCEALQITGCTANQLTGTNKFADIDPDRVLGGLISNSTFTGTEPVGAGIGNATINLVISDVAGLLETKKIGEISLAGSHTIDIVDQGVAVEVLGTWNEDTASQFELLTTGSQNGLVYLGVGGSDTFRLQATVTGNKVGGGTNVYQGEILIDGVPAASDLSDISDRGGKLLMSAFVTLDQLELTTLAVANTEGTSDLEAVAAQLSIFRVF